MSKKFTSKILYLISYNEPFSISKSEIIEELGTGEEKFNNIINSLQIIEVIGNKIMEMKDLNKWMLIKMI